MVSRITSSLGGKALFTRTLTWFLPMAVAVVGMTLLYIQSVKHQDIITHRADETTAVLVGKATLAHHIDLAVHDLIFVQREFDENRMCDDPQPYQVEDFRNSLTNLALANNRYDQIRWIGNNGMERLRLNANAGHPGFAPNSELQNKQGRYYVSNTLALAPGDIYISPLDLNVEHGKVEQPYRPMLRIGTPVSDAHGDRCGLLLLNYLGVKIIDEFTSETSLFNPRVMLLNQGGYYLRSPQAEDEWGFMFGHKDLTLGHRFPAAWQRIESLDRGQFMDGDGLWTFETVDIAKKARDAGAAAPENQHDRWKVVSHLDRDTLFADFYANRTSTWIKAAGLLALLLLLSWRLAQTSLTRDRLERKLAIQAAEYEDLYNFAPCGYHSIDKDGHLTRVNQTELDWLGYARDELIGKHFTILHANPDEALIKHKLDALHAHQPVTDMEFELRRKDGTTFPVSLSASPVYDDQGKFLFSRSMLFDLKYRKVLENKLKMEARSDPLTGLHNRRSFAEMAEHELSRSRRMGSPLALMLFDIDFFKNINDRHGHDSGDVVLQSCSRSSARTIREIDILARWGGEEFIALLPGIDGQQAMEVAERLRQELASDEAVLPDGQHIAYTVSIGVTSLHGGSDDIDAMVKRADEALYAAKQGGRNRVNQG
jgi:diguanylate cyclase (GGDEF)-like protein/PAS domain S-box-containing protein